MIFLMSPQFRLFLLHHRAGIIPHAAFSGGLFSLSNFLRVFLKNIYLLFIREAGGGRESLEQTPY